MIKLVTWSFAPAAFLITLVLGSIFAGWATPTEAAGVGSAGAMLLAVLNRQFNLKILTSVLHEAATTNALVFFIIFGATLFSYVFRALGGDDVVAEILKAMGIDTGWEMLIFVMALVFFMGFFFDWIEICLVVIPIFAPLVGKLDYGTVCVGKEVILLLVRHPARGQHADGVPNATIRLRALLHERHGAPVGNHGAHLSGHHPVRIHPAGRAGSLYGFSDARAAVAALLGIPGLMLTPGDWFR